MMMIGLELYFHFKYVAFLTCMMPLNLTLSSEYFQFLFVHGFKGRLWKRSLADKESKFYNRSCWFNPLRCHKVRKLDML